MTNTLEARDTYIGRRLDALHPMLLETYNEGMAEQRRQVRTAMGPTAISDSWGDMIAEIRRLVALHAPKAEPVPPPASTLPTLQSRLRGALHLSEIAVLSGACVAWVSSDRDEPMPVMMPGQLMGILEMRTGQPVEVEWDEEAIHPKWWVFAHCSRGIAAYSSEPCPRDSVEDRNEAIVRAIEATFKRVKL